MNLGGVIKANAARASAMKYRNTLSKFVVKEEDIFEVNLFNVLVKSPQTTNFLDFMKQAEKNIVKSENFHSADYYLDLYNQWEMLLNSQNGVSTINETMYNDLVKGYKISLQRQMELCRTPLEQITAEIDKFNDITTELDGYYSNILEIETRTEQGLKELASQYQKGMISDAKILELGIENLRLADHSFNLTVDEMLAILKTKDLGVKEQYKEIDNLKIELNQLVQEKTKFKNYDEFHAYITGLANDKASLIATINQYDKSIQSAEYVLMTLLSDYQNYTNKIDIITPLEKYEQDSYKFLDTSIINLSRASVENPELAKMYNYLYENKGESAAKKYLDSMEDTINQINGQMSANAFLSSLKDEKNLGDYVLNHLKTATKATGEGVESYFEGLAAWFNSSKVYTENEYETMYILQALTEPNNKYTSGLSSNYEMFQSVGNMLPSITLSIILGGTGLGEGAVHVISAGSMGASAGGNSYHGALVEGYSTEQSLFYGLCNGLSEAGLEYVLGGISGISDFDVVDFGTWLFASGNESIEEGSQAFIDALMRKAIFGEEINWSDTTKDAIKSGAYGAVTAGMINSVTVSGSTSVNKISNVLNSSMNAATQMGLFSGLVNKNNNNGNIDLSTLTLEKLQSIENKDDYRIQTSDGKVYNYNDILELLTNKETNTILKNSPVEGSNIGEIGDHMVQDAENKIKDTFNQNASITNAIKGILLSPLEFLGKFIYTDVKANSAISNKILSEGLYHITSMESAQKIMESGYVKQSDVFTSYGRKKTFFFAGEPTLERVSMNLDKFETKRVAVKFNVDENNLSNLVYRKFSEQAVANYGDFHFNPNEAEIVYLGLQEVNGELVYKELTKEEYDHYKSDMSISKISSSINNMKNSLVALSGEYNMLNENIANIAASLDSDVNYEYMMQLVKELQDEKNVSNTVSTVQFTENQVRENIKSFDLESFLTGKTENNDSVVLITPKQSIMSETLGKNGNFEGTVEAINKIIYPSFEGFSHPFWIFDISNGNNIIIEMSNNSASSIWMPSTINQEQFQSLTQFYNELADIYERTGEVPKFTFARETGGLEVLKLAIDEAERRLGNVGAWQEELVMDLNIESTLFENIKDAFIPGAEFSDYTVMKQVYNVLERLNSNNDEASNKIVKNFSNLIKEKGGLLSFFKSTNQGGTAFSFKENSNTNNQSIFKGKINDIDIVTAHEFGHLLFDVVSPTVPSEYQSVRESVLNEIKKNDSMFQEFLIDAVKYSSDLQARAKLETQEYFQSHSEEVQNYIEKASKDITKIKELCRNVKLAQNGVDKMVTYFNEGNVEKLHENINKLYKIELQNETFFNLRYSDHQMQLIDMITGVVDSLYEGNNPYLDLYQKGNLRLHSENYFNSKNESIGFNEQFADYTALRNYSDVYETAEVFLKKLIGNDWFSMMDAKYESIAVSMENLSTTASPNIEVLDDIEND